MPRGDEDDGPGRERDAAVLNFGDHDARGERRDRLVPQRLLDRYEREPARVGAELLPLVGMVGEQPHGVRELALAGVDPADEDVQDEIAQLVVAQPVALLLRLDQR